MTIKITKGDLTKALARPWAGNTCLVAQSIMRTTGRHIKWLNRHYGSFDHDKHFKMNGSVEAQIAFDDFHFVVLGNHKPLAGVRKFIGTQFELIEL